MHSALKWLILIQLLLNEQVLCRAPPPPVSLRNALPSTIIEDEGGTKRSLLGSQPQLGSPHGQEDPSIPIAMGVPKEDELQSSKRIISTLRATLKISLEDRSRDQIRGNVSCGELLSATTLDDPSSTLFPQELLSLSMVPVLAAGGCQREAQTLVLKLFDLLGMADTEELLMEVASAIERRATHASPPSPESPVDRRRAQSHLEAVMFNIRQLAMAGEAGTGRGGPEHGSQGEQCEGWTRVNGTMLLGKAAEGAATGGLQEAVRACESLGFQCAGVTRGGLLEPGRYRAVLKKGSRVVPSESPEAECWIRRCDAEQSGNSLPGGRARRSPRPNCINKEEEQVYNVVEWIPAVSTLYNLGTAMYYASINCSETAKERAILSAVDLGTDALMAVTGGTAGVAGYALGAGVKTGVKAGIKYLLTNMKHEDDDLLVNQNQYSWEEGLITIN